MSSDYSPNTKASPQPPPLNHTTHHPILSTNYPVASGSPTEDTPMHTHTNEPSTTPSADNSTYNQAQGTEDPPRKTHQTYKAPPLRWKEAGQPQNYTPHHPTSHTPGQRTPGNNYRSNNSSSYNYKGYRLTNNNDNERNMSPFNNYRYNNDFRNNNRYPQRTQHDNHQQQHYSHQPRDNSQQQRDYSQQQRDYSQQQGDNSQQQQQQEQSYGQNRPNTMKATFYDQKPNLPNIWLTRNGRKATYENAQQVFGSEVVHKATNLNPFDNIPVEITGDGANEIPPIEDFKSAKGIHPSLITNLNRVGYTRLTPVQKHAIPTILRGRDLVACAQTGSGKTAAFLLPIISSMLNEGPPRYQPTRTFIARRDPAVPVCLILSPTRELTLQIYQESKKFAFSTGIRTCVVYGGNDVRTQIFDLDKGCDICVATPGRLNDLMERHKINLQCVKHLVLDEADRMLDMGFYPQMKSIILDSEIPSSTDGRQTVMFSATFPREVQKLAKEFLLHYIFLSIGRVGSTNTFIRQKLLYVQDDQKSIYLLKLLRDTQAGRILIFVETKRKADQIEASLTNDDFKAVSIHGDKSQLEREDALRLFKDGSCRIMVATDVAARGLDIPNITHVINFDIPNNIEDYVHRIGRTGRAGNKGLATSFVNESNWPVFRDLVSTLEESKQEVPQWFQSLVTETSYNKGRNKYNGRGGQGGGGGGFAHRNTRDMRNPSDQAHYTHSKGGSIKSNTDYLGGKSNYNNYNGQYNNKDNRSVGDNYIYNKPNNYNNNNPNWKGNNSGTYEQRRWYDPEMNGREDAW